MLKLLVTNNDLPSVNIGDYIQSLAAKQYFDDNNFVTWNRDCLNSYDGEQAKVVMNAWFTYQPENFPPSKVIIPLFTSFHLNPIYGASMLERPEVLMYFKSHQPIGCRDRGTAQLLENKGIQAYFSSCLTTTLDLKYKQPQRSRGKIVIVDPMSYLPKDNSLSEIITTCAQFLFHSKAILSLTKKYKRHGKFSFTLSKIGIGRLLLLTKSYLLLKSFVSEDILNEAIFVTHIYSNSEYPSDIDRFNQAEKLVRLYGDAELVITSRIHCALPCLGLGTPVILLRNKLDAEKSASRFGGLEDFFNSVWYKDTKVVKSDVDLPITEKLAYELSNKNSFRPYADKLKSQVQKFFKEA